MASENVIGKQIVKLRNQRGYTQDDLAKLLGYSKQTVSNWETGFKTPRMGAIQKIADLFNVQKSFIIDGDNQPRELWFFYDRLNAKRQHNVLKYAEQQYNEQNNVVELPANNEVIISGAVSAGTGEYLGDSHKETVIYSGNVPKHDFAVIVNGDSMEPTFADKQIIFVKKTSEVRNGQFVIADYDHQAYVKKFMRDEKGCRLVSLNKKYNDMPINDEHELSIFGVVVL